MSYWTVSYTQIGHCPIGGFLAARDKTSQLLLTQIGIDHKLLCMKDTIKIAFRK